MVECVGCLWGGRGEVAKKGDIGNNAYEGVVTIEEVYAMPLEGMPMGRGGIEVAITGRLCLWRVVTMGEIGNNAYEGVMTIKGVYAMSLEGMPMGRGGEGGFSLRPWGDNGFGGL